MRASHLYTGMFLVPWMIVYAVSAFCLNHSAWFVERFQPAQKWEVERETDFAPDAAFPADPDGQAQAILAALDLEGAYRITGVPDANQLTLMRLCVTGHYRITWQRQRNHVVVDRLKPVSFYSIVNNLHFVMGYGQSSWAYLTWAALVDAVTISTVIWVISGIYLWARWPRKRLVGGLCLAAGSLLFVVLVTLLCR
jgi:hypothetical protein